MKDSFWINTSAEPGSEALFRGKFRLEREGRVRLCMVGASWYQAWIDGQWLLEGPFRYPLEAPEFQSEEIDLPAGDHVLVVVKVIDGALHHGAEPPLTYRDTGNLDGAADIYPDQF